MRTARIEYGANGIALDDFLIPVWIDCFNVTMNINDDSQINLLISSEIMIDGIRSLVAEGKINHNQIVFIFNGKELKMNYRARFDHWPEGFCELKDKYMEKIIYCDNKRGE